MEYFLSCDWGTSAFRLRLVTVPDLKVIAEEVSDQGISGVYQLYQLTQPANRPGFYLEIVAEHIRKLEIKVNLALEKVPVVVSGMASSSIGLLELPYHELPFALDGSDVKTHFFRADATIPHDLVLISGIKSEHDVMRGEETQLIGLAPEFLAAGPEQVYIFPGTHSKHILVQENRAVAFKTYMTGEFFALLAEHSILRNTISAPDDLAEPTFTASFTKGVKAAIGANLLHAAFRVRTNNLFGRFSPAENLNYLSGLIIGSELQDLLPSNSRIYLVAGERLQKYYHLALQTLGLSERVQTFPARWVDEAVVRGQYKIYQHLINQL
jgi:2-dehydro-3-deoxygalactonokinase